MRIVIYVYYVNTIYFALNNKKKSSSLQEIK